MNRVAELAREYNTLNHEYAMAVMRRIRNVYLSEEGEIMTLVPPDELETREEELKEAMNQVLYELDQELKPLT